MAEKKPDRHARRTCKTLIRALSILAGIELHGQTGALGIDCQFTGGCESTQGTPVQQVDPSGGGSPVFDVSCYLTAPMAHFETYRTLHWGGQ